MVIWCRRLILDRRPETQQTVGVAIWPAVSAGVFLAGYRQMGAWYDVERLDMLFLFLILLGGWWLSVAVARAKQTSTRKSSARASLTELTSFEYSLLAAVAFTAAFFTKQQAILSILAGCAALVFCREWRVLIPFAAACAVLCARVAVAINGATHGWFVYYCFVVPLSNGIKIRQAIEFLALDVPLYAPMLLLAAMAAISKRRDGTSSATKPGDKPGDIVFFAMAAAGFIGSWLSRAHWGGAENVLMAGFIFIVMAGCIAAGRLENDARTGWFALLAATQIIALAYNPLRQVPTASSLAAGKAYTELVRRTETSGEVLCIDHGGFTTKPHFQIMGLADVLGTEKKVPAGIQSALEFHRYAAIITDAPPEPKGFMDVALKYYPNITHVDMRSTWIVTGFVTPSPARSVYIMRP
jgi:hypothetical protein